MKKYTIKTHKSVNKFLKKHTDILFKFIEEFEKISKNPFKNNCDIKLLKGSSSKFRLRIGKYRFLYEIIENEIVIYIYKSNSRGNIYK